MRERDDCLFYSGRNAGMIMQLVAPRLMVMGGGAVAKLGEVLGQLGL